MRNVNAKIAYVASTAVGAIEEMSATLVPKTRTVNGKALSSNISLSASDVGARPSTWTPSAGDVGAVPTTRKVNNKALSSDITLTASDVGATTEAQVSAAIRSAIDDLVRPDWVETIMPSTDQWQSVTYGNGKFVAVAKGSDKGDYSTDGINWTAPFLW